MISKSIGTYAIVVVHFFDYLKLINIVIIVTKLLTMLIKLSLQLRPIYQIIF